MGQNGAGGALFEVVRTGVEDVRRLGGGICWSLAQGILSIALQKRCQHKQILLLLSQLLRNQLIQARLSQTPAA